MAGENNLVGASVPGFSGGDPNALQTEALYTGRFWRSVIGVGFPLVALVAVFGDDVVEYIIGAGADMAGTPIDGGLPETVQGFAGNGAAFLLALLAGGGFVSLCLLFLYMRLVGRRGRRGADGAMRRIVG